MDHLSARQQPVVLGAIKLQLQHEPFRETRNRKRLRPNPLAPWELRVGTLRIFYEADAETRDLVNVLAIGVKKGNRLLIDDKEIRL
jgi:mRNA-degrading endonuclease RelE of RelBE toxin-antitoxin system